MPATGTGAGNRKCCQSSDAHSQTNTHMPPGTHTQTHTGWQMQTKSEAKGQMYALRRGFGGLAKLNLLPKAGPPPSTSPIWQGNRCSGVSCAACAAFAPAVFVLI